MKRLKAPDWLEENWEQWGKEYKGKIENNSNYKFSWKQYKNKKVNHRLLPILKEITSYHCSFCDGYPMGKGVIKETIEHFRPKTKFPLLSYKWDNLFLACQFCQEKGDTFDRLLLKPDELNYTFEQYFIFNFKTFEIEVRKDTNISQKDKNRANKTLELYKLNEFGRPEAREWQFRLFNKMKLEDQVIDDFAYRFMFI